MSSPLGNFAEHLRLAIRVSCTLPLLRPHARTASSTSHPTCAAGRPRALPPTPPLATSSPARAVNRPSWPRDLPPAPPASRVPPRGVASSLHRHDRTLLSYLPNHPIVASLLPVPPRPSFDLAIRHQPYLVAVLPNFVEEWVPLTSMMLTGLFSLIGTLPPARNHPVKLWPGDFDLACTCVLLSVAVGMGSRLV